MRKSLLMVSVPTLLPFAMCVVNAQELPSPQTAALTQIRQTAQEICTSVPIEGSGSTVSLTGNAKAKLEGGIGKVVGLGIDGAAKYESEEYRGVLQKDLAEAIKKGDDCRLTVLTTLAGRLIPALPPPQVAPPRGQPSIFSTNIAANSVLVGVMYPPPGNPTLLINEKAVIVDGKDGAARLADIQKYSTHTIYRITGSPADLNMRVGPNKLIVKYGDTQLPEYEFTLTETQKERAEQLSHMKFGLSH